MSSTIDYYFAPISPWAYLGHARFARIAASAGARVNVLPIDFGKVFPLSGGLPLAQRAAQRQAYRLVELARFSAFHELPLTLKPKFFPVPADDAARLITTVAQHDGSDAAMALTGAVLRAVWAEERNVSDATELAAMIAALGLPARRLAEAKTIDVQTQYEAHTQRAIELGVFGAPTYLVDGEMFWGQDRLDFLERRLARA